MAPMRPLLLSLPLLASGMMAHGQMAQALADLAAWSCLSATPPGLMETPEGMTEGDDWATFAGAADRYWLSEDQHIRTGITFGTVVRACEFAVDGEAITEDTKAELEQLLITAVRSMAAAQGADLAETLPENIRTFDWEGVPQDYTAPMSHHVELSLTGGLLLMRSTIQ